MNSKNNGKLAIAIVAMFVVALSIVGITYAYFSATVVGNTKDKSVDVTAGILEINYAKGNTIKAQNIVPGWVSDGAHYYDPNGSVYDVDGQGTKGVKAITKTDCETVVCSIETPGEKDGITDPVTFSVKNTDKNTGTTYFAIELVNVENGIVDTENLTYKLYKATAENATTGGTLMTSGTLVSTTNGENDPQIIVNAAETLTDNDTTNYYYLMLEYANADTDQYASIAKTVKATVKVEGLTLNNGKYFNANGKEYFASQD